MTREGFDAIPVRADTGRVLRRLKQDSGRFATFDDVVREALRKAYPEYSVDL